MSLMVDIEKTLGKFHLRVSFESGDETMALLGASGSGKSMTLKCIAGILPPDHGRIILNDVTLFDSEKGINLPPQQRRVGYLFQNYALFPHMTAEENILCGVRSGSRIQRRQTVRQILEQFQMTEQAKLYPDQLSGGQQQRVALARILVSAPNAILLDEPLSALDQYLKWNMELELSQRLQSFSGPKLWVTHDLGECSRSCNRVCVLSHGCSGVVGPMDALLNRPQTVDAARLAGYRNILPAHRQDGKLMLEGWELPLPDIGTQPQATVAIPERAITLGYGPQKVVIRQLFRDLHSSVAVLSPEHVPDAPVLWACVPAAMLLEPGAAISLTLDPDACLIYDGPCSGPTNPSFTEMRQTYAAPTTA